MDLFKEIDDLSDLFLLDKNGKLDSAVDGYEDLQSKYSSLHENYAKELENSKKVGKCLLKCLKFYSKLCKKYEVQQTVINNLEESIKKKVNSLEEAQRNEEKLKGLIQVYRSERVLYAGQTTMQLRKEKEILLDICCKLVSESVRSNNVTNLINQLLRKFKKDLDDDKIILLKSKTAKLKDEFGSLGNLKSDIKNLKDEEEFNSEDKYSSIMAKEEIKNAEEDTVNSPLDLSLSRISPEKRCSLDIGNSPNKSFDVAEEDESQVVGSLPSLEESPTAMELSCSENNKKQQDEIAIKEVEKCDLGENKKSKLTESGSIDIENSYETVGNVVEPGCYGQKETLLENHVAQNQSDPQEFQAQQIHCSKSIFDISDICLSNSEAKVPKENENVSVVSFESNNKVEDLCFINDTSTKNLDLKNFDEESNFPYENELVKIFKEMSSVRMISPIRERNNSLINSRTSTVMPNVNKSHEDVNLGPKLKRNSQTEVNSFKNKKLKSDEKKPNCCLLDSIMSAMSIQNEEFKSQSCTIKNSAENRTEGNSSDIASLGTRTYSRIKKNEDGVSEDKLISVCHIPRKNKERQQTIEKLVTDEIKNFVSSPILCKEDADKNVRHCISVLSKKPEDLIAKCIVAIILENVEETVEVFERPAPPLTKTQHRLVILLSVIRTLDWDSEKISTKILSLISEKLFPDNFFWPDDSVEEATRFYAALCRAKNDSKTLWKFCLNAMTGMRQRCPILMFTVLKTWPDILYDASTLKNNILAVTVVNIFLHMPKTEGLRNLNQRRKLGALKHLLMNFYQFKVEDTIENYTKKVLEAVCRGELGSEKALVLLSRCRDQNWTIKTIVPTLNSKLVDWMKGNMEDSVANIILSVIKQICPIFVQKDSAVTKFKEIAVCLSEILVSGKKNHDSEVNLIEVLLQLKQFPDVRKVIREWIPKSPISEGLRNEIINVSAENILRELKLNRKKKLENFSTKKKQWKKVKGKKKKGKKRKKNEQKSKGGFSSVSSKN